MRRTWSEVGDEVTRRTDEDDERAMEWARAFEGFEYGRAGRCPTCNVKPHPVTRRCLCGGAR